MKKQNADPTIPLVPDEELVSPNESPTEADDDPDGERRKTRTSAKTTTTAKANYRSRVPESATRPGHAEPRPTSVKADRQSTGGFRLGFARRASDKSDYRTVV